MTRPSIAVILPAFNEALRIEQTLATIAVYRAAGANVVRVIVSDDGSDDDTAAIARRTGDALDIPLDVYRWAHRGKALAVRDAMLAVAPTVDADYLMMLDADDELKIDQLDHVVWNADPDSVYIGRRVADVGGRASAKPSLIRRTMSLTMRAASRGLLGIPFPDTQCGFKLFPRRIVPDLFGQQRSTGCDVRRGAAVRRPSRVAPAGHRSARRLDATRRQSGPCPARRAQRSWDGRDGRSTSPPSVPTHPGLDRLLVGGGIPTTGVDRAQEGPARPVALGNPVAAERQDRDHREEARRDERPSAPHEHRAPVGQQPDEGERRHRHATDRLQRATRQLGGDE